MAESPKATEARSASDGHAARRAARRAEILEAATEVFFEEGYERATMDQVLRRVGGSKRTLYSHFPSKEHLFAAIVTQVSDRVLAALEPPPDGELREALVTMGERYLGVLLSPDGIALYRSMVAEAARFPALAELFYAHGPGRALGHLTRIFARLKREGTLNLARPESAASQFIGMLLGTIHLAAVLGVAAPSRRVIHLAVQDSVDVFLDGVRTERGTSP